MVKMTTAKPTHLADVFFVSSLNIFFTIFHEEEYHDINVLYIIKIILVSQLNQVTKRL